MWNRPEPLKKEVLVNILLKEYDALRKEIEARTDATKTYSWPVVAAVAGVFVGWKNAVDIDIVFFLLPIVGMLIIGLVTNAAFDMDKARVGLIRLESQLYELTNRVLLSNESRRFVKRETKPDWPKHLAWGVSLVYLGGEIWLHRVLNIDNWIDQMCLNAIPNITRLFCLSLLVIAPALFYLYNAHHWAKLRNRIDSEPTALIELLRSLLKTTP